MSVQSRGLWLLVPTDRDKEAVIQQALIEGQNRLEALADPKLIEPAKAHARQVLGSFFEAMGWRVEVRWNE